MGRGDDAELTPSDAELAAAEAETRGLLARFAEPSSLTAPETLTAQVLARLPAQLPRAAPRSLAWTRMLGGAFAAALAALVALGIWGVLADSFGPARLAGGADAALGQLLLLLTLAAKPLVNLLGALGPGVLLAAVTLAVAGWLWWRLVQHTPLVVPAEVQL